MSREKKKKSTKPKYCTFTGTVTKIPKGEKIPKKLQCPVCKRRMEPSIVTTDMFHGFLEEMPYIKLDFKKDRMKK